VFQQGSYFISKLSKNKKAANFEFYLVMQGTKLTFFSRSHLASKYLKVVANSKKLVGSFLEKKIGFIPLF